MVDNRAELFKQWAYYNIKKRNVDANTVQSQDFCKGRKPFCKKKCKNLIKDIQYCSL